MSARRNITDELTRLRRGTRNSQDDLVFEAKRILKQDLFADEKILGNLKQYNRSFETLDEENLSSDLIFRIEELRQLAIIYRLKFLDSKFYKSDVPYEAILKIKQLNGEFHKDIKHFKLLALPESFSKNDSEQECLLFAKTNYDNYYLLHNWGNKKVRRYRRIKFWPLRKFENLVATVLISTLVIAASLPTKLITLDPKAEYWSGYRAAAFFHLLIFNLGVTAYITFAFGKNFSSSIWNKYKDFD